jgi:radical SAM protein with 4Fe4S-binding SPASM domain
MSKDGYGFLNEPEKAFPAMVVVEITNVCNLACVHCPYPHISRSPDYRPRHMDWGVYAKIVREVAGHPGVMFRLICDGEPLMHPRFLDMVRLAKSNGLAPVNVITNGMLLDEAMVEGLLDAGVDVVEVSLDALTKATYEKIRIGSDFDLVISNLERLIAMRDSRRARTRIFVSIIDQKEAEAEVAPFVAFWSRKVDRVLTRVYTSIGGLVDEEKLKIDTHGHRWPCPQLWRRLFINVDGKAEFCVEDWKDETVVGDVNKESIARIWQSPEYARVRDVHLRRAFNEIGHCRQCKDWKAREWGNDYFHAVAQVLPQG